MVEGRLSMAKGVEVEKNREMPGIPFSTLLQHLQLLVRRGERGVEGRGP
jgi:hypothetical protein